MLGAMALMTMVTLMLSCMGSRRHSGRSSSDSTCGGSRMTGSAIIPSGSFVQACIATVVYKLLACEGGSNGSSFITEITVDARIGLVGQVGGVRSRGGRTGSRSTTSQVGSSSISSGACWSGAGHAGTSVSGSTRSCGSAMT